MTGNGTRSRAGLIARIADLERAARAAVQQIETGRAWQASDTLRSVVKGCGPLLTYGVERPVTPAPARPWPAPGGDAA
jgi:hypothetical protein